MEDMLTNVSNAATLSIDSAIVAMRAAPERIIADLFNLSSLLPENTSEMANAVNRALREGRHQHSGLDSDEAGNTSGGRALQGSGVLGEICLDESFFSCLEDTYIESKALPVGAGVKTQPRVCIDVTEIEIGKEFHWRRLLDADIPALDLVPHGLREELEAMSAAAVRELEAFRNVALNSSSPYAELQAVIDAKEVQARTVSSMYSHGSKALQNEIPSKGSAMKTLNGSEARRLWGYEVSLEKLKVKFDISNDITLNLQSNDTGMLAGDLLRDMLKKAENSGALPYCQELSIETGLHGISVKTKACLDVQMPYSMLFEGKGDVDLKVSIPPVHSLVDLVASTEHDDVGQQALSFVAKQHELSGDAPRVGGSLGFGITARFSFSVCFFNWCTGLDTSASLDSAAGFDVFPAGYFANVIKYPSAEERLVKHGTWLTNKVEYEETQQEQLVTCSGQGHLAAGAWGYVDYPRVNVAFGQQVGPICAAVPGDLTLFEFHRSGEMLEMTGVGCF